MKTTVLILVFLIVNITSLKSQTDDKKSGFYDLRLSYVYSVKGQQGEIFQSKIPYGLGLSCDFKFNKRFYSELGIVYKKEGVRIEKGFIYTGPMGYSGDIYHQFNYSYFDIPIQLHFNFLELGKVKLFSSAGFKGTMCLYEDNWNPDFKGVEFSGKGNSYGIAYCFGLMEYFKLTKQIELFASQNYGRYFKSKSRPYEHASYFAGTGRQIIDLKIGLSFKFDKN